MVQLKLEAFADGWSNYEARAAPFRCRPFQPIDPNRNGAVRSYLAAESCYMPSKVSVIRCNSSGMLR